MDIIPALLLVLVIVALVIGFAVFASKQGAKLRMIAIEHQSLEHGLRATIAKLEAKIAGIGKVHRAELDAIHAEHNKQIDELNNDLVQRQALAQLESTLHLREVTISQQGEQLKALEHVMQQQKNDQLTQLQQIDTSLKTFKKQFEQSLEENKKLQTLAKVEQEKSKALQSRLNDQQTQYLALQGELAELQKHAQAQPQSGGGHSDEFALSLEKNRVTIQKLETALKKSELQNSQINQQLQILNDQKAALLAQKNQQNAVKQSLKPESDSTAQNPTNSADLAELLRRSKEYDNIEQALKQSESSLKKMQAKIADLEEKLKTADAIKQKWGDQSGVTQSTQSQGLLVASTTSLGRQPSDATARRLNPLESKALEQAQATTNKLLEAEQAISKKDDLIQSLKQRVDELSKPSASALTSLQTELVKTKKQLSKASNRVADLSLQLAAAQEKSSVKRQRQKQVVVSDAPENGAPPANVDLLGQTLPLLSVISDSSNSNQTQSSLYPETDAVPKELDAAVQPATKKSKAASKRVAKPKVIRVKKANKKH